MSWATCYSGSNNIHFNTPPFMSDGRLFTNFNPSYDANTKFRDNLGIKNNFDYRQWLIGNGKFLTKKNSVLACNECSPCVKKATQTLHHQKYLFESSADVSTPYGYENSDLKNLYFSRHALQSKLVAPILTQEQILLNKSSQ
tara:strand:+ start:30 stop:455 length:426 start_codon:yes stop_codon:yes gene_type:complete